MEKVCVVQQRVTAPGNIQCNPGEGLQGWSLLVPLANSSHRMLLWERTQICLCLLFQPHLAGSRESISSSWAGDGFSPSFFTHSKSGMPGAFPIQASPRQGEAEPAEAQQDSCQGHGHPASLNPKPRHPWHNSSPWILISFVTIWAKAAGDEGLNF